MKWFGIFAAIGAAIGLAAINFRESTKTYTHQYKLTITVETTAGQSSGSSVIEVSWLDQPQRLPISVPRFVANIRGDAPIIELDGGVLVAPLGRADVAYNPTPLEYLVGKAFHLPNDETSIPLLEKQRGARELSGNDIPALILFTDRNDPRSARIAQLPTAPGRQLAPGVTFLSAKIEMTSDPVTRTVEKKLRWWSAEDRPASVARHAWLGDRRVRDSVEPESLFRKGR